MPSPIFIGKFVYQLYQHAYQDIKGKKYYNKIKGDVHMEKIYKEPNTNYLFTFSSEELKKSFYAFLLKNTLDSEKRLTRDELYNKLGKKLYISPEAVRKHIAGNNTPNDIKIIYGYGEFLENGDRYAFLKLHETDITFNEKAQDILSYENFAEKCVKAVYSALVKVISEYAASDCFNRTPDNSDALLYYRRKMDSIEAMIQQLHGHDDLANEMLSVTHAIKKKICSCDFPGVPSSWYSINPNLRFYTVGFSLMVEDPDFYKKLKNRETWIGLDYYPEESETELGYEYFAALYKNSEDNNFHYNIDDFFQQELINTIKIIFDEKISVLLAKQRLGDEQNV